jgi:hypothetical protein
MGKVSEDYGKLRISERVDTGLFDGRKYEDASRIGGTYKIDMGPLWTEFGIFERVGTYRADTTLITADTTLIRTDYSR